MADNIASGGYPNPSEIIVPLAYLTNGQPYPVRVSGVLGNFCFQIGEDQTGTVQLNDPRYGKTLGEASGEGFHPFYYRALATDDDSEEINGAYVAHTVNDRNLEILVTDGDAVAGSVVVTLDMAK